MGVARAATTAQKLAAINALTVTGPAGSPLIVPTYKIYDLIVAVQISGARRKRSRAMSIPSLLWALLDGSAGTQVSSVPPGVLPKWNGGRCIRLLLPWRRGCRRSVLSLVVCAVVRWAAAVLAIR